MRHIPQKPFFFEPCGFVLFWPFFALKKNRRSEQNLLTKNFASTKTIGGDYTTTAVELRNGRGQVEMIFCIFSGPLRPRAGKMFSDPPAGNSGEKPGMEPERAGEGPEKVLRKICVFRRFVFFSAPFLSFFVPCCLLSLCVFLTPLYTYRFCLFVFFLGLCPEQVPGPPPFINTSCPGVSRVRVPGCPGAGPVPVSRGVPGSCVPGCPGPRPGTKRHFLHIWPFRASFWHFISWGLAFVLGAPWRTEARFPLGLP